MNDEQQVDNPEEYEEISSDEVDRVVEALEELADSVASENIRALLEDASQGVYELVYDDEDEVIDADGLLGEIDDEPTAEAA